MSLIDDVGIEIALDAVLVDENVRPAMLVQPANSGERTHNDPITKNILKHIKRHFPHFIFSDDSRSDSENGLYASAVSQSLKNQKNFLSALGCLQTLI